MSSLLPDDILHLICVQLRYQRDFNTLFNCALSSKQLATPALVNLYRMHDAAPVKGGSDEVEVTRQGARGETPLQQLDLIDRQWTNLWRNVVLSSLGKTKYPYCRYIRALDLRDLKALLEDSKGKISGHVAPIIQEPWHARNLTDLSDFFQGELSRFNIQMETPIKLNSKAKRPRRLNTIAVLDAIGEVVTTQSPMLEELSGEILASALSRWIPRLPHLQHMTLWRGAALADGAGTLINEHCPSFKTLKFYEWLGSEADSQLAKFLNDIRPQSLESLEIFSYSDIGAEAFLALNYHSKSMTELKLNSIKPEAMPFLSLIKDCTTLTTLLLAETTGTTDLERVHNDVFLEIIAWLRECKGLQSITFRNFMSGPAILTPILLENNIYLTTLELKGYVGLSARDFHLALAHQKSLRTLWLEGDAEDYTRDDVDALVTSLCKLTHLVDLRLKDISEYFRNEHICRLARNLIELEEFSTSGYGITDSIWPDVSLLTCLRRLEISALAKFTADGILEMVSELGEGNQGLHLFVMMADPESSLSDEEQSLIRETMAAKVDGKFDYMLAREPGMSDFETESD